MAEMQRIMISTQPKIFRYKKTGFFRKNPVFLKTLHPKIYVALLITDFFQRYIFKGL